AILASLSTSTFNLPLLSISTSTGPATIIEENVPVITPISIANAKPRVTSPPTINKINTTKNTVSEVIMVRGKVSLIARLTTDFLSSSGFLRKYSRIRSNTMIVSFIEKPITVNTAAIKCWSISSAKGTLPLKKENTANVDATLNTRDTNVPTEYCHLRKRTKI